MSMSKLGRLALVGAILGTAGTLPVVAQDGLPQDRAIESNQAEAWLSSLESQLQLQEAQRPAFAAYVAAIREQALRRAADPVRNQFVDTARLPPAPEALERRVAALEQRLRALQQVQAAAAKLYATLNAQQRIVFDFVALTPTGVGSSEVL
jgi:hypothetical protein